MPQAARANTPAGAEAFIRFYFEQINEAWTTPKAGLLPPHSDPGCQFCTKTEDDARQFVSSHRRYSSRPVGLGTARQVLAPPDQVFFEIEMIQNATTIVDGTGRVVDRVPRRADVLKVGVAWTRGRWVLLGVEAI